MTGSRIYAKKQMSARNKRINAPLLNKNLALKLCMLYYIYYIGFIYRGLGCSWLVTRYTCCLVLAAAAAVVAADLVVALSANGLSLSNRWPSNRNTRMNPMARRRQAQVIAPCSRRPSKRRRWPTCSPLSLSFSLFTTLYARTAF